MSSRKVRKAAPVAAFLLVASLPVFAQSGHYALILRDAPVASRFASREAMRAAEAESYRRQITSAQQAVRNEAAARNIPVTGSADTLLNAVFVAATPDRMSDMQSLPGILAVIPMPMAHAFLNRATTLMNAPAAWTALGGQSNAGQGVRVGILDYGIDQTHPAFQDSSLPMPAGFPKCTDGHPEDCAYTNNKVIVARSYVRQIAPGSDPKTSRPDDYSPRDREGHGTAVASCIAANTATGAVTITGMAPKAYLGSYKVFGSPYVNDVTPASVLVQALEDALKDGMDIVNFSAGFPPLTGPLDTGAACGLPAGAPCDPLATAFENAAKAGLTVVVATGNGGSDGLQYPTFNSITSPADAPSVIAVGATTNSHYFGASVGVAGPGAPSNLQTITAMQGDDPYAPFGALTAPLRDVTTLGNDGLACTALPAGSLSGAFALIQRGTCPFADKLSNALDAGAVGMVLYMADSSPPFPPGGLTGFGVPVAMISLANGQALKSYINANPNRLVTIDPSGIEYDSSAYADQLAYFSSFGPTTGDSAIKPDLVAVGDSVYMAAQSYDPLGGFYSTSQYVAWGGTSFASPLVAGAAALVKQKHPSFTPAQIKSALVNAASQSVKTDDSGNPVDVEWLGAGKLDAGAAVNATITVNPASLSFGVLTAAPSGFSRQITLTNTGSSSVTLAVAVAPGSTSGIVPTLDKSSLTLLAGASGTVAVSLSGALPKAGSYSGAVTFQASGISLRAPYLYLVGSGAAYNITTLGAGGFEGIAGQAPYDPLTPSRPGSIALKVVDSFGVPVAGAPVTWSVRPPGGVTFQNASTATNSYGIAATDLLLVRTGSPMVTATAGGLQTTFSGFVRQQPTIPAGGVVSAANHQAPAAPGSYAEIFGSALSDPGYTDSATTAILPLEIDGVTVSFDVPSANISVPGRLVFVSPGQVNVQVPWELQGQASAQVKVTIDNYSYGNVVTVPLADYAPAFFEGGGVVAARDANNVQILPGHPALRGQVISLYANGLGPVTNQPASGDPAPSSPPAETKSKPVVTIGGQTAQVLFSGLAPGFAGLYQINVTVPPNVSPGSSVSITVSIKGQTSKASAIPIQ